MDLRIQTIIASLVTLGLAMSAIGHAQENQDSLPPEVAAFVVKAPEASSDTGNTETTVEPSTTDPTETTDETNTAETELTAEQLAFQNLLDKQLLGVWSLLVVEKGKTVTDKALNDAAVFCLRKPQLRSVKFQAGAEAVLPDTKLLFGNIAWYRTPKGLQRADLTSNKVALVNSVTKGAKTKTGEVWTLTNDNGAMRIVFGEAKRKDRKVAVMFEEHSLFLKCPVNISKP